MTDITGRSTLRAMDDATETVTWGEIDGQTITFPMRVPRFDAATLVWSVPAPVAQRLVPDAFEVIELIEGVAQFVVALCDYHENPWGDYLELNLGFLARPAGSDPATMGSFVYRMPVDQEFTCKAGNQVMGFPKTVEDLEREAYGDRIRFAMNVDGRPEVAFTFAAPVQADAVTLVETESYSLLDGVPHATPLSMEMGSGVIEPSTVEVELGRGEVAEELRELGLPKAPDFGSWGTDLRATFGLGRAL